MQLLRSGSDRFRKCLSRITTTPGAHELFYRQSLRGDVVFTPLVVWALSYTRSHRLRPSLLGAFST